MLNFYNRFPSLDLHGETGEISKILVKEFIEDNYKMKNEYIVLIHGIGKGIVRKNVYQELKKNSYVKEYKQDNFNPGCTIIKLDIS